MGIVFDQSLNTSDSPTFGGLTVNGSTAIDGAFTLTTPSGTGNDVRVKVDDGGIFFELYSYSGNTSPYLRIGGLTPGTSGATTLRLFESGGNNYSNFGDKDGVSMFTIHQSHAAATLQSDGYWGFSTSASASYAATPDTRLYRDGADILALRNGTNANEFRVYNTYTDASNYERASLKWDSNVFRIESESDGTGSGRGIAISSTGAGISINTNVTGAVDIFSSYTNRGRITLNGGSSGTQVSIQGIGCGSITLGDGVWDNPNAVTQGDTLLGSSGTDVNYSMTPTYNQTGTAGSTDFKINRTETALGSGEHNFVDFQVGGSSVFKIDNSGSLLSTGASGNLGSTTDPWGKIYGSNLYNTTGGGRIQLGAADTIFYQSVRVIFDSDYIGWSNSGKFYGGGANTIDMRGGTNAQTFRVYNTYTDASNNEYLEAGFDTNVAYLRTVANGTGILRTLAFEGPDFEAYATGTATNIDCDLTLYGKGTGAGRMWLRGGTSGPNKIFSTDIASTAAARQLDLCAATTPALSILTSGEVEATGDFTLGGIINQGTSSAADPTTTELPSDKDWGVHKNTTSGNVFLAYNDNGSIVKVQLT